MKDQYQNPRETICLILFNEPQNVEYICRTLYNKKRNSRVTSLLRELRKKKWIKDVIVGDRRNHYVQSTTKCFIDSIEQRLKKENKKLNIDDKKRLKKYFSSPDFKSCLNEIVESMFFEDDFNEPKASDMYTFEIVFDPLSYYFTLIETVILYLYEKKGIDYTNADIIDELFSYRRDDGDRILSHGLPFIAETNLSILGRSMSLISKLSNISEDSSLVKDVIQNTIQIIENVDYILEKRTYKSVNGNGHGLS